MISVAGGIGAAAAFSATTLCYVRLSRMMGPYLVLAWVMLVGLAITIPLVVIAGAPRGLDAPEVGWLALAGFGKGGACRADHLDRGGDRRADLGRSGREARSGVGAHARRGRGGDPARLDGSRGSNSGGTCRRTQHDRPRGFLRGRVRGKPLRRR